MHAQNFLLFKWLVFLVVFACLPFPHGNIYAFIPLLIACIYHLKKYRYKFENINPGIFAFFGWALLSAFWAIDTLLTIKLYAKVTTIVFCGYLWMHVHNQLNKEQQYNVQHIVFIASLLMLVALFIFVIDIELKGRLYAIIAPSIASALIHAAIACSIAVWTNLDKFLRMPQFYIVIIAIFTLKFATSDAATLGMILGGSTLLLNKFLPRLLKFMFIYGMPIVWFLMPFTFRIMTLENYHQWANSLDPSYTHRLFIWHAAVQQIFERFWTGFGFGSSRFQEFGLKAEEVMVKIGSNHRTLESPVHPHNYMLQVWLELGAIGVTIACLAWVIYWRQQYQKTNIYTIAFWGSVMCIAATSISIWQSWWLFLVVTLIPIYNKKNANNSSAGIVKLIA